MRSAERDIILWRDRWELYRTNRIVKWDCQCPVIELRHENMATLRSFQVTEHGSEAALVACNGLEHEHIVQFSFLINGTYWQNRSGSFQASLYVISSTTLDS
jgi:hypothetical protein